MTKINQSPIFLDANTFISETQNHEDMKIFLAESVATIELGINILPENRSSSSSNNKSLLGREFNAITEISSSGYTSKVPNTCEIIFLRNNFPIIHGPVLEFKNDSIELKAIWITNGNDFINVRKNEKVTYKGYNSEIQLSDRNNNDIEFNSVDLVNSKYYNSVLSHIGNHKENYNNLKDIGAFAITKNNDLWICYRRSAQKIGDIDNWLISLLGTLHHFTKDKDLIESITHSSGTAG